MPPAAADSGAQFFSYIMWRTTHGSVETPTHMSQLHMLMKTHGPVETALLVKPYGPRQEVGRTDSSVAMPAGVSSPPTNDKQQQQLAPSRHHLLAPSTAR